MTAAGADFLYTVVIVTVGLILMWALAALVREAFTRIEADYRVECHTLTFADDFLHDRDHHIHDVRWAMRKARRDAERRAAA